MAYRIITIRVLWIREFDKFIFCVCHTRKTVQASGSPMFFLLLRRPPVLGDHPDGVWAALARASTRSSRGGGRTAVLPTSASRRGRRRRSVAPGAGRRRPAGRSRRRSVPPARVARQQSSRGDGRTGLLPTSASHHGRRRGSAATGAGRRCPAGVFGAASRTNVASPPKPPLYLTTVT